MRLDGLIFDKDGTLFDYNATWGAWSRTMLAELSGGDDALARRLGAAIGFDLELGLFAPDSPVIAGTPVELDALLAPLLDRPAGSLVARMNAASATAPQVAAAPLVPLLRGFRDRGLRLGLATNDAEAPARAHLTAEGVLELFDFIAGSDSGHGAKPLPGQLEAFLRQTGLAADRVAMVGDTPHDLHAGRAAGMTCIAVLTGPMPEADLAPLADVVLPDISALPEWLEADGGS